MKPKLKSPPLKSSLKPTPRIKSNQIFKIRDLNLWYSNGKRHALRNINLDLYRKKVTAFIGPSGCGKSTFLRCFNKMNDLIEGVQITGSIKFEDKFELVEANKMKSWRNLFGLIHRNEPHFENKDVLSEQMMLLRKNLKNLKRDKQSKRRREELKMMLEKLTHEYNQGIKIAQGKIDGKILKLRQDIKNLRHDLRKKIQGKNFSHAKKIILKSKTQLEISKIKQKINTLKQANVISSLELRTRVGMVFQKPNPFPMSIFDNVAYGPRSSGIKNNKELMAIVKDALIDAALWEEVQDTLHEPALSLSGGQQQRLCIARALAMAPEVLLMDEPTSALDPIATSKIERLINDLGKKYTIIIVTHSMQQATRISHHTAFFYLGELIEYSETRKLFTKPEQKLTRDYIRGKMG